jgi:hypothetical protein
MGRRDVPMPQLWHYFRIASVTSENAGNGDIAAGSLVCAGCPITVPIVRNIPRFVPSESYASSFGFQWKHFDRIQIDKFMRITR